MEDVMTALAGKVALVTGIGRSIAVRLGREGTDIADEIIEIGSKATIFVADVAGFVSYLVGPDADYMTARPA